MDLCKVPLQRETGFQRCTAQLAAMPLVLPLCHLFPTIENVKEPHGIIILSHFKSQDTVAAFEMLVLRAVHAHLGKVWLVEYLMMMTALVKRSPTVPYRTQSRRSSSVAAASIPLPGGKAERSRQHSESRVHHGSRPITTACRAGVHVLYRAAGSARASVPGGGQRAWRRPACLAARRRSWGGGSHK